MLGKALTTWALSTVPRTISRNLLTVAQGGNTTEPMRRPWGALATKSCGAGAPVPQGGQSGGLMNAIVYTLPAPSVAREAQVITLPTRTKYGLQGVLALEWPTSGANAVAPCFDGTAGSFDPQPTASSDLPPAGPWSMRLVHGMVEVINGVRPASQLTRWVAPEILGLVQQRVLGKDMPRFTVRSVHVTETHDGVAEVSSVFGTPNRAFALAMRLDGLDGRWRATSLIFAM